jgi:hypothetical protein
MSQREHDSAPCETHSLTRVHGEMLLPPQKQSVLRDQRQSSFRWCYRMVDSQLVTNPSNRCRGLYKKLSIPYLGANISTEFVDGKLKKCAEQKKFITDMLHDRGTRFSVEIN